MEDKRILDCESVESTYKSLEKILGVTKQSMEKVFQDLDIDSLPDLVLSKMLKTDDSSIQFDSVCWFHLTRTVKTNNFEQGILPLDEAINLIWDFLYTLVDKELPLKEWIKFKSGSLSRARKEFGPFAVLVREGAFRWRELGNHDYLAVPEIVEDVSIHFGKIYKLDLLERFKKNTSPCIVKFIYDRVYPGLIGRALYYLYTVYRGLKFSHLCTTNFCGQNEVKGKNRILKIEFPEILEE